MKNNIIRTLILAGIIGGCVGFIGTGQALGGEVPDTVYGAVGYQGGFGGKYYGIGGQDGCFTECQGTDAVGFQGKRGGRIGAGFAGKVGFAGGAGKAAGNYGEGEIGCYGGGRLCELSGDDCNCETVCNGAGGRNGLLDVGGKNGGRSGTIG